MNLIPWKGKNRPRQGLEPVEHPLASFRQEVDSLFDRFLSDPWGSTIGGLIGRGVFPQLDMVESDKEVTLRAELPGVRAEDVRIEVTGNVLKLSGEKSAEHEEQTGDYRYSERQFGAFSRIVQLPASVDSNKVDAVYKDGVLTITLAKLPEHQAKRITVRNA